MHQFYMHIVECKDRRVIVGSLKINIGRAEGAAGIFRVIKAALMLENLIILTYRNFKTANERIPLQDWKLKVRYWVPVTLLVD